MKYEAVIFDLYGTLIDDLDFEEYHEVLRQMADALSLPYENFLAQWREISPSRALGTYKTVEECLVPICRALEAEVDADQIKTATDIRMDYMRSIFVPRDDALTTLSALTQLGHKLGLISDCSSEIPLLWSQSPFAPLISHPVFSSRAGVKKPNPEIYRIACDQLEVEPQDCLYIGDGNSRELTGATQFGMTAVLIAVPDAPFYDHGGSEARSWRGPKIASLAKVLEFV